ncbi:Zn-dependent hydrolase [Solibacillus sp. FSL W7-1464]|uniref:Zn-dependent hydrolase n=1 Tax=Solibacillus sp. FSL W7-1464 TaxID=2921706 RepID=UPI0030F6DF31
MIRQKIQINSDRLTKAIDESAGIGELSEGGIRRLALTDEDKKMRNTFIQWLKDSKLEVRVDDFGNIYGRREGLLPDAPAVLIGSHLDTQPEGGRFDGIVGVLAGLEVIRTLNDYNIQTEKPIEIVNFTNEEGARFEPPLLGAGGATGHFDKEFVYSRKDKDGKTFLEELKRIGFHGEKSSRFQNSHCYIELHIEQGPVLEHRAIDIGVVTGIQGIDWLEVKITGQSDHAGPTPMNMRKDALYVAAKLIQIIRDTIVSENSEATATVGRMEVKPNSINSIPGEVVFSVDIRHSDDRVKEHLTQLIIEKLSVTAAIEQLMIEIKKIWESSASDFSAELIDIISETSNELGYSSQKMVSGAGHDSKYMNEITPTAMIFIQSEGGKSHCKEEFTSRNSIDMGANVLLHTICKLACASN